MNCLVCGEDIEETRVLRSNSKYCSRKCLIVASNMRYREKHLCEKSVNKRSSKIDRVEEKELNRLKKYEMKLFKKQVKTMEYLNKIRKQCVICNKYFIHTDSQRTTCSAHCKRIARHRRERKNPLNVVYWTLSRQIKDHMKSKNGMKTLDMFSFDRRELKCYLEGLFETGMTWDNYGKVWDIDHIIPWNYFMKLPNLTDLQRVVMANAITNFIPRFKTDALAKQFNSKRISNYNKKDNIIIGEHEPVIMSSVVEYAKELGLKVRNV